MLRGILRPALGIFRAHVGITLDAAVAAKVHDWRVLVTGMEIHDLLSFEELSVSFSGGLNVVVGQNDVGKSNLVRLVRLVRDRIAASPGGGTPAPYGFEQRYVRLGGPRMGRLSIGVRFSEERERALLVLFLRAIAAQAAEPSAGAGQPRTPDEWRAAYQRYANLVEASLSADELANFFEGRLVMHLDARQPARWALAYEFDHGGATYHVAIQGHGLAVGMVAPGGLDMDRMMWSRSQLGLADKLDASSSTGTPISLADLLPPPGETAGWEFSPPQNNVQRPLTLQLARELGLAADNSRYLSFAEVVRSIAGRGIVTTENLRRPPVRLYTLEEARTGLAVEDAGDLPLEFYRRKNGGDGQRDRFRELQDRFARMTGRRFDLAATIVPQPAPPGTTMPDVLDVELQVESRAGWIPIEHAGAGLWEALVALSAAVPEPGQVVFLDEPAAHLHSSWQREFLRYLRTQHQIVMITHSPFLVPADSPDDFSRVIRLARSSDGARALGMGQGDVPSAWKERWRQILAGSADARAVLFARGVLLVEGETEVGAFGRWFNDAKVVGGSDKGAEALNLVIISVDGDWNFGPYVSYLEHLQIPWAILADGPALSPDYEHSLSKSLTIDPATSRAPTVLVGMKPESPEFGHWRSYWLANGVFTVAETFGLKEKGEKFEGDSEASGEVERFFSILDDELWASVKMAGTGKVRRGYRFAEQLDLDCHAEALDILRSLWRLVSKRLHPGDGG